MAPKKQNNPKNFIYILGLFTITFSFLLTPIAVQAAGETELSLPDFSGFVESVSDGNAGLLKGVYVPNVFSFPIIQQPVGNPGYVSQNPGVITQFSMATEVGNVGLLAHNHLAGQTFTKLNVGDEVRLVYGDGEIEYFIVTELLEYQALQPSSPYSEFRDLETDETMSAVALFRKVYRGKRHVTFQVCIEAHGNAAWGRLFVIAEPVPNLFIERIRLHRITEYLASH